MTMPPNSSPNEPPNPYSTSGEPLNPYAAPNQPPNPYAAPNEPLNPYAAPNQPPNPYAAPNQPPNPYAAPNQYSTPGYPAQPYPPQAYPPAYPTQSNLLPVATPPTPTTVNAAFGIYLLVAVVTVVGLILSLTSNVWNEAIAAEGAQAEANGVSVQSLVSAVKIGIVILDVIFIGLYLLFAFKMRAGRNWARVVLTVLTALSIASSSSASGHVNVNGHVYVVSSSSAVSWIAAILGVAAIVLMYLAPSNRYFATCKLARRR